MTSASCPPHTWLLPSHGGLIEGVCQNCGARRMFDNMPPTGWGSPRLIQRDAQAERPLREVFRREWPDMRGRPWREE